MNNIDKDSYILEEGESRHWRKVIWYSYECTRNIKLSDAMELLEVGLRG